MSHSIFIHHHPSPQILFRITPLCSLTKPPVCQPLLACRPFSFLTGWEFYGRSRRFPEITGEDNLTVFSYSGRVKSPEWRWQRRRADLRHFEIFRHGPIIIYTRLPAGGTYYPICTFPASSECLIGISDAFSAFCLRVSVIFPTCSLYPQQKRAYSALHPQAWTYIIYWSMPEGSYRVQSPGFPKIVYYLKI